MLKRLRIEKETVMAAWLGLLVSLGSSAAAPKAASPNVPVALTISLSTNYYTITGATQREIYLSLLDARPWKTNFDNNYHGFTDWRVNWHYRHAGTGEGSRKLQSARVDLRAVITLPRLKATANADPDAVRWWQGYLAELARHEMGHFNLGKQAAEEVKKFLETSGSYATTDTLNTTLKTSVNRIVDKYLQKEKEYDAATRHGMTQFAPPPPRPPRPRS